jgi:hypothetical protein
MAAATSSASSTEVAVPYFGAASPAPASTSANAPRSSARWMASGLVPTIGTPAFSSARARPSGVCPPSCTITPATGPLACSACTTSSTSSRVSGSKYSRPEVS